MFFRSCLLSVIILAMTVPCAAHGQGFVTVSGTPETSDFRYSEGSSWGDINGDGYLDLFVPHLYSGNTNLLFINKGDGTFRQAVTGPVVADDLRSTGGVFGDFDNDGDLDLFVSNYFGDNNALYMNEGDGSFEMVTAGAIVNDGGHSFGASMTDFDGDGWLDLFVVNGFLTNDGQNNALYRNNGDGTFAKVVNGPIVNDGGRSSGAAWCDFDADGDIDLFVANGGASSPDVVQNVLYLNDGLGSFTRVPSVAVGISNSYASSGSCGDYDNDGDLDLMVTNFLGNDNILYTNNGDATFTAVTGDVVVQDGGDSVSSTWGDYDNDGWLDLYVTNDFGEDNNLYRNNGDGSFSKIVVGDPVTSGGRSNGATWADYNRDGFLDLYVPNGERPIAQSNNLYRNIPSDKSWIHVHCTGNASGTSAVGTKVRVKASVGGEPLWQLRQVAGSTGFNAQNSTDVEFGLGDGSAVDSLVIEWSSGQVDVYVDVAANIFYVAEEGTGLTPSSTSTQAGPLPHGRSAALLPVYPNPFDTRTTVTYTLRSPAYVRFSVYDVLGRRVGELALDSRPPGTHEVAFDATGLPPGVYLYSLEAGDHVDTGRMVLAR